MAWLEAREKSWRVVFRYEGRRCSFTVGEVERGNADAFRASTEELLRLL